jgi:uncharacterized Zn finger protein
MCLARTTEETYPREAIELYRQRADRVITQRGRQNYQQACRFLTEMRALYEKPGDGEIWTSYVAALVSKTAICCVEGRAGER